MAALKDFPDISTNAVKDEAYIDPADYIFEHSEYHDVTFNVGINNDETETIRAVKVHLVGHSSVFRQLLLNKKTETQVRISNMCPQVFKLILRHVYGGEISNIDPSTAGQLALAADTYNIRPLVKKACRLIVPKSANDVFPALLCVANISCAELEPEVTKIVQEETQALLNSKYFLDLDSKCLEFISRQEKLSVTELELWRALIRWAQNEVATNSNKTLRQHLQFILPYVRLLTFSLEDFSKEVVQTKILTSDEVVELLSAIANKDTLDLPGLCSNHKLREQPDTAKDNKSIQSSTDLLSKNAAVIGLLSRSIITIDCFDLTKISEVGSVSNSSLSIYTLKETQIESFIVKSQDISNKLVYDFKCNVTVYNSDDTLCKELSVLEISKVNVVPNGDLISLPLKLKNGQPVILKGNSAYTFELKFNECLPSYSMLVNSIETSLKRQSFHSFVILPKTRLHIRKICYRV